MFSHDCFCNRGNTCAYVSNLLLQEKLEDSVVELRAICDHVMVRPHTKLMEDDGTLVDFMSEIVLESMCGAPTSSPSLELGGGETNGLSREGNESEQQSEQQSVQRLQAVVADVKEGEQKGVAVAGRTSDPADYKRALDALALLQTQMQQLLPLVQQIAVTTEENKAKIGQMQMGSYRK